MDLQSFVRQRQTTSSWANAQAEQLEAGGAGAEQVVDSVEEEAMVKRAATAHVEEEVEVKVDSVEEEEEMAVTRLKMRVWRRL